MDFREYKKKVKRGVTYIEVLVSLFIVSIIITIAFPYIVTGKSTTITKVTNSIVTELKNIKSVAISKNSNIDVRFLESKAGGYSILEYYCNDKKIGDFIIPKGYVVVVNLKDLDREKLVFKLDGTLNHRATTIRVREVSSYNEERITLTIGYTRIMRVD